MRYFATAARGDGLGATGSIADPCEPGDYELGAELGWLPSLDEEQQRVGFDGAKHEELDRTSWIGRLQGSACLPAGWVLDGGWIPPVEVKRVESSVVSVGVARSLLETRRWRFAVRLSGDYGRIRGDITCDAATVSAGADPELNPFNCLEPSSDAMTWWSGSVHGILVWNRAGSSLRPFVRLTATHLDAEFRVEARYGNLVDRSLLTTEGSLTSMSIGVAVNHAERWRIVAELAYTPLSVVRSGHRSDDGLVSPRLAVSRRF